MNYALYTSEVLESTYSAANLTLPPHNILNIYRVCAIKIMIFQHIKFAYDTNMLRKFILYLSVQSQTSFWGVQYFNSINYILFLWK